MIPALEGTRVRGPMTLAILFAVAAAAAAAACGGGPRQPATPSPGCAPLWADSAAAALVGRLVRATETRQSVWGDYDLGDAWYVIHAGESAGGACLGAWTGGRAVAYAQLPEAPRLSTPLYGFYIPEGDRGAVPSRGDQPEAVTRWLESLDAGRATIIPVAIQDFPLELSTLTKVQVALHEGFHVHVQSPHWAGRSRGWPVWDRQPDRTGLAACYRATEAVASTTEREREQLARTVEALLDGAQTAACAAGRRFLAERAARHRMLAGIEVVRADSTPGTCREAEAIMELEEGTADYASWTQLFAVGLADRDRLLDRYRAIQDDVYYLTGAMQLHAVALMRPDGMAAVARRIARSASPAEGSITAVFADALDGYCR